MKRVVSAVAVIASVILARAVCAQTAAELSQKELLKNWALSRCLATVYADPEVRDDASATAAAYLEFGNQPMGAYEALDALVDRYARQKRSGSVPSQFNTMKCIELFRSNELDSLAGAWAPQPKHPSAGQ